MSPWTRADEKHSSSCASCDVKFCLPASFAVLKLGSVLSRRDKQKVREVRTGGTGRLCPTREVPRADAEISDNHECQPSHGSMLLLFGENLLSPKQICGSRPRSSSAGLLSTLCPFSLTALWTSASPTRNKKSIVLAPSQSSEQDDP